VSGNVGEPKIRAVITQQTMDKFKVSEKVAEEILEFATTEAQGMMDKWTANQKRNQKIKAEEIYELIKQWKRKVRAKRDDNAILGEIERKILELCVG
jgi:hypothetical protein